MTEHPAVRSVARHWFAGQRPLVALAPLGQGHINDTWLARSSNSAFVLQRLNPRVFADPRALMDKVAAVVAHLRRDGRVAVPALIPTESGMLWAQDAHGEVWRLWEYVATARTLQPLENSAQARAAGRAFGLVQLALADLALAPPDPVPGFMQLGHYLARLDLARMTADCRGPVADALSLIEARRDLAVLFGCRDRLVHGDCKVDNLLFHSTLDHVTHVIDLDTVMRGHWGWDFGDLVRSAAAGANGFDLARYAAVVAGFVGSGAAGGDVDGLVLAPRYVALMLAVRFVTDHLEGDRYFKVNAPGDNLVRGLDQLALLQQMEMAEPAMRAAAQRA